MTNYFREGDYSAGILQAYGELTRKTYEEYGGEVPANVPEPKQSEEESVLDIILGIIVTLGIFAVFYFFFKYVVVFPIAVVVFVFAAILHLATHGKYGTLSFGNLYFTMTEFISLNLFSGGNFDGGGRSSGGGSGRGGGFGGGRSGGGGSSGGW